MGLQNKHVRLFLSSADATAANGVVVPIRPGGALVGLSRSLALNTIFLSNSAGTLTVFFGLDDGTEGPTDNNTIWIAGTGTTLLAFHNTPVVGPKSKGLRVKGSAISNVGVTALGRVKAVF